MGVDSTWRSSLIDDFEIPGFSGVSIFSLRKYRNRNRYFICPRRGGDLEDVFDSNFPLIIILLSHQLMLFSMSSQKAVMVSCKYKNKRCFLEQGMSKKIANKKKKFQILPVERFINFRRQAILEDGGVELKKYCDSSVSSAIILLQSTKEQILRRTFYVTRAISVERAEIRWRLPRLRMFTRILPARR